VTSHRAGRYDTPEYRASHTYDKKKKIEAVTFLLKGIVHPKMKILSSFTHPQIVPNL